MGAGADEELVRALHRALDMADRNGEIATLKADVEWLKKLFWVVAGSAMTAAVASVINLVNGG